MKKYGISFAIIVCMRLYIRDECMDRTYPYFVCYFIRNTSYTRLQNTLLKKRIVSLTNFIVQKLIVSQCLY